MKRIEELIALVRDKDDFFANYSRAPVGSLQYLHFKAYDEAFMFLDDESWEILKLKAVQHFAEERSGQRKQGFFHHLNEAFAYKFLAEKGFQVRFMREGKKGPDLKYIDRGTKYCEVKSIGLSDDEIERRNSTKFHDGKTYMFLNDNFMNILRKVVKKALLQVAAVTGTGFAFVVVTFDDLTKDFLQTYRAQLTEFCDNNPSVAIKNGDLDNDIIFSPALFK